MPKVSLILHTKDREQFLVRAVEYYKTSSWTEQIELFVIDASEFMDWKRIEETITRNQHGMTIEFMHHHHSTPFSERIAEALKKTSTRYAVLAADDDLYFDGWLSPAVRMLDNDDSYGVIYGHTLRFALSGYHPYGELVSFGFSRRIPPERWLEDESVVERLAELGKSDWATVGWYALQKKEVLSTIIDKAIAWQLDGPCFELLMIFGQAALTKTRMIDEIYLARQTDWNTREPYSYQELKDPLIALRGACVELLRESSHLPFEKCEELVDLSLRNHIAALMRNDQRAWFRSLTKAIPHIGRLKKFLDGLRGLKNGKAYHRLRDSRFPQEPPITREHQKIQLLAELAKR